MELVLIRHGLPVRSQETSDPPLSAVGRHQARRVGERLLEERFDAVFASTMLRAIETAEPLAAAAGHSIQQREGIVEFDRAAGTYIPMEELKREDYARWKALADGEHEVDIEAFHEVVAKTLEEIIQSHGGKRVAVFCHGGVINVWTAYVLKMAPRLFFQPDYASVHRYLCASTGQRNIVSLNDVSHLREATVSA
jgi:probable phosphoglycerate mutase